MIFSASSSFAAPHFLETHVPQSTKNQVFRSRRSPSPGLPCGPAPATQTRIQKPYVEVGKQNNPKSAIQNPKSLGASGKEQHVWLGSTSGSPQVETLTKGFLPTPLTAELLPRRARQGPHGGPCPANPPCESSPSENQPPPTRRTRKTASSTERTSARTRWSRNPSLSAFVRNAPNATTEIPRDAHCRVPRQTLGTS